MDDSTQDPFGPLNELKKPMNIISAIRELQAAGQADASAEVQTLEEITGNDTGTVVVDEIIAPAPDVEVLDPEDLSFYGAGMTGGGRTFGSEIMNFWAVGAGVLQVGFNNLGKLTFGAGAGSLSVSGMQLDALEYPGGVVVEWLADDTAAQTGSLYSFYTSNASALYLLGKGKSGSHVGTAGMAAMTSSQTPGQYKSLFQIKETGVAELLLEAGTGKGTQGLGIRVDTSETNEANTVFSLSSRTTDAGGALNGFGTAMEYKIEGSAGGEVIAGYEEMTWLDKTAGSEDTRYQVVLKTAGSDNAALTLTGGAASFPGTLSVGGGGAVDIIDGPVAFTPTIIGTTAAGAGTYTTQLGTRYTIGKLVYYKIELVWTAHTGTGNMRIGNLPYTAANDGIDAAGAEQWNNIALAAVGNKLMPAVIANTTQISLNEIGSGPASAIPMDTAGTLRVSGCYIRA